MARPRDICDITKLAAEGLVQDSSSNRRSSTVLRISRCFPEEEKLMAIYRLYRGVDLRDVVQAHALALDRLEGYGLHVISGPMLFKRDDPFALHNGAAGLIEQICPTLSDHFKKCNWSLPKSIDRVYSSELATNELGYWPNFGVQQFLQGDRQPDAFRQLV